MWQCTHVWPPGPEGQAMWWAKLTTCHSFAVITSLCLLVSNKHMQSASLKHAVPQTHHLGCMTGGHEPLERVAFRSVSSCTSKGLWYRLAIKISQTDCFRRHTRLGSSQSCQSRHSGAAIAQVAKSNNFMSALASHRAIL